METTRIAWSEGIWTHPPVDAVERDGDLIVTCAEGSDAWRTTSYGFVHESEHGLVRPLPQDSAMEVTFTADYDQQFDQAGIFVVADQTCWMKAGGGSALSAAALATAMPTANAANSARRFNGEKRCKDMDIKRKTHPFFSL